MPVMQMFYRGNLRPLKCTGFVLIRIYRPAFKGESTSELRYPLISRTAPMAKVTDQVRTAPDGKQFQIAISFIEAVSL